MKRDMRTVFVPFPAGLMNTAAARTALSAEFSPFILNMLATAEGAGSKRGGCVTVGPSLVGQDIVRLFVFQPAGGALQYIAVTASGQLWVLQNGAWSTVYSGLNPTGVVRGVVFAGRLVLCNGMDDVLVWDGTTIAPVQQWVLELGSGLTFISATQLSVQSQAALYPVGRQVRLRLGSTLVHSTVAAVSSSGNTVTVTLTTAVLNNTLNQLEFGARPPRFNYLYAAHDRLWGCGTGELHAQGLSGHPDRARVFYTHGVNNATAWHDTAGLVPSIGLSDKAAGQDELLAMSVKDGMTIFLLRQSCQVWTGTNPTINGDFTWQKTIPVGVVQGDAVVELPNDVAFLTSAGLRTLARVVQTEQLDVSDVGSALDPTFTALLPRVLGDAHAYRRIQTCSFAPQGWFGVQLLGQLYVFQVTGRTRGWVVFDGLLGAARAYARGPDGRLFLARNNQVYCYDPAVFSDAGAWIATCWETPWLKPGGKNRWANSYMEVVVARSSAMLLALQRTRNLDDGNGVTHTLEARLEPEYWDSGAWETTYFDVATPTRSMVRDHFIAEQVGLAVHSSSDTGPLTLLGINLYGAAEQ